MPNYSVANTTAGGGGSSQQAVAATYKTLIAVCPSTQILNPPAIVGLRRGRIYDILIGTDGTPADNYMEFDLANATIVSSLLWLGSISSLSSNAAIDKADPGFSAFCVINASLETNITSSNELWYVGINQRASYRWVAAPGSELVWPAVSNSGFALRVRSGGYTGNATGNILFTE